MSSCPDAAAPDIPHVSIITPAYNRASLIDETIRSVLEQDYENLEYIVIDDGSSDDTLSAIKRYGDALRWATHPNMGETRTVNRGFSMARGDIIGVINSDDPLCAGALRILVARLMSDPNLVAVYPDWSFINEYSQITYDVRVWDYCYRDMVRLHYCMPGPGTLFRRSLLETLGGWDESLRYVADYDFWLRAGLIGPLAHVPFKLATFRRHAGSTTVSSRGLEMAREHIRVIDKLYSSPGLPEELLSVQEEAYRNAFHEAALLCSNSTDPRAERFQVRETVTTRTLTRPGHRPEPALRVGGQDADR